MHFFYELKEEQMEIYEKESVHYPPHIHKSMECIYVTSGTLDANVKHFFTLLGKMFFTSYGKEFFIYHGKQIFTSQGKHLFTRYGKQTLSSAQPCG